MSKLPMIFFALLAPALFVLAAIPVAVVHIAVHVLIDRAAPPRAAVARTEGPTWKSPLLQRISTLS